MIKSSQKNVAIPVGVEPATSWSPVGDDEFGFNDTSTHEDHLRQNGVLLWFCNETAIMVSHICMKM